LADPSGKALSSDVFNVNAFDPRRWRNGTFDVDLAFGFPGANFSGVLTGLPASVPEQLSTLWCLVTSAVTLFALARLERLERHEAARRIKTF